MTNDPETLLPDSSLYVVDVCGTLVHEDTTVGLLRFHFRRVKAWGRFGLATLITARASPARLLFMIVERFSKRHVSKVILVSLLKGQLLEELQRSANVYADHLLKNCTVDSVQDVIRHRPNHSELVLASASLSPIVEALARRLQSRFVASRLAVVDGVLTGAYAEDITGRKPEILRRDLSVDFSEIRDTVCLTDNLSDKALLDLCDRRIVVLRNPQYQKRWFGLDAEFVQTG